MWVTGSKISVVLAGLVGLKLLTSLLTTDEYGRFALLTGLAALPAAVLCAPLLQATLRYYADAARDGRVGSLRSLAGTYLARGTLAGGVLLVVGGVAASFFRLTDLPTLGFVLAAGLVAVDSVRGFDTNISNAARRQREFAIRLAVDGWARPLAAVGLIVAFGPHALLALSGYVGASTVVSAAFRRRRREEPATVQDAGSADGAVLYRSGFIRFALPLAVMGAFSWFVNLGDRYFLAWLADPATVGIYATAYGLGSQPFLAFTAVVHATLRPLLYDAVARKDRTRERRVLWAFMIALAVIAGGGCASFWLLAPQITRLFLGPRFAAAKSLIPWVGTAYAFLAIQQGFEGMLLAYGKTHRFIILQAITAAVGIAAYAVLIPRFGALGAAWSTLATFAVGCFVSAHLAEAPRRLFSASTARDR